MRIDRLDLSAFGGFTDKSLDLSAGKAGLHLIYGNNEAGKSTSLRAIIAWLFGIPARTTDNYLHHNSQLRIGGQLRLDNGKTLEFIRRKGNKSTLLHPDNEQTLADSVLAPYLPGAMDEALFKQLHGIDYERLEAGGKALLEQSGDIGQALFSAAMGVASPRSLLASLKSDAEALFRPRAQNNQVNQAIRNYKEARKRTRESSLSITAWKQLNQELADTVQQLNGLEQAITEKSREKSCLERINRVKVPLAERRNLRDELLNTAEVQVLAEDFALQCKACTDRLQNATTAKMKATNRLADLEKETDKLNIRHELLDNEAEILGLYKELGAVEKSIKDRPQQDGQHRLLRNEAADLLKAIRPDLPFKEAKSLRPLLNREDWIRSLSRDYDRLAQQKDNAEKGLQDANQQHTAAQQELAGLSGSDADLSALNNVVNMARKAGDIEDRLAELTQSVVDEHSACQAEFQRLGYYPGPLENLLQQAMPLTETLTLFEGRFQTIKEIQRDLGRKQQELNGEITQSRQELDALLIANNVPTLQELETSRDNRNRLWQQVRRHYIEHEHQSTIEPESAKNPATPTTLPSDYERQVRVADRLSDRLRLDADQVAKRTELETRIQRLQENLAHLSVQAEQEQNAHGKLLGEWQTLWQPLGIQPGVPAEMKQWLLRAEKLLARLQAYNITQRQEQKLAARYQQLKEEVATQLGKFQPTIDLARTGLQDMLDLSEHHIQQQQDYLNKRKQLEQTFSNAEAAITRITEELDDINNKQNHWREDWQQAIAGLGLSNDAHPELVNRTFKQLITFVDQYNKSEEKRRRIWGIDKDKEEFSEKVFAFAKRIQLPIEDREATTLTATLQHDLDNAKEQRTALQKLQRQQADVQQEIKDINIDIQAEEQRLNDLMEKAGVTVAEELAVRSEASAKKRVLQQRLTELEKELIRSGDGKKPEVLEQEAAGTDIDTLDAGIERISSELAELNIQRDQLRDQRTTLQNQINAHDGSATAANAAEEAEQHLGEIINGTEQYLRLQIAALILEQRIEDYRNKHQTPLLLRAGELFARLTVQAYQGLRDELDNDNKPILLGVRPDNTEVLVDRMSEGTRAQLYLSLRLATLEQNLANSESMPLVVDDILIGFDDQRTKAGLEVLANLAKQTQVLIFTHHQRVLDLARDIQSPAGIYTHALNDQN